jgi:aminoglycoside 3-N-acetyltransferase
VSTDSAVTGPPTRPATVASITTELRELGVVEGSVLLVHSSLRRLGYVAGGAQAVVDALLAAVGGDGTVVVPAFSAELSDPARWIAPPVPESWWPILRNETPAFDPRVTPTRHMGAIVDCFLRYPDVRRSQHPRDSFAARGPHARAIVDEHRLAYALGEHSPLARIYDLDGWVLLLGVDHGNNTSLHLAEYRADMAATDAIEEGAPVMIDGRRQWVTYADRSGDDADFATLGEAFAQTGNERGGRVGTGTARLMRQRGIVDFGARWLETHRP